MAKILIKKEIPNKVSSIEGIGDVFVPLYHLYIDDKLIGVYINIGDAAKEGERQMDCATIELAYKENPLLFKNFF